MRPSLQLLDSLIYKLEASLGKQHRYAPSTAPSAAPVAELVEEEKATPLPSSEKEGSQFDLWSKIDIRVGRLAEVWKHPESTKLYCEKIDIGEPALREIASGLQEKVLIEEMTGLVLIMANLKARKLAGFNSNGMVLCASKEGSVVLLRPPEGSKVGEKVALESEELQGESRLLPTLNPKHKVLEQALPLLRVDSNGFATYAGQKLRTSGGLITSLLSEAPIS
jgi:methionine--tRNA ligase beta chain